MKKITYKKNDETYTGYIASSVKDIEIIRKEYTDACERIMQKFVLSNESSNRYGHVIGGLPKYEKSIAIMAVSFGAIHEKNPIYMLDFCVQKIIAGMIRSIARHEIFINSEGGYRHFNFSDEIEILSEEDVDSFERTTKHYIRKNTKFINFENDWELERSAVNRLEALDKNFSYITELRLISKQEFSRILDKFKENGGDSVYVYTTGMDVKQMYQYSTDCLKKRISNFVFEFNSGLDDEITEFLEWLAKRANVKTL